MRRSGSRNYAPATIPPRARASNDRSRWIQISRKCGSSSGPADDRTGPDSRVPIESIRTATQKLPYVGLQVAASQGSLRALRAVVPGDHAVDHARRAARMLRGANEVDDRMERVLRQLDELHARAVQRGDVGQFADVTVRDASLDDDRAIAKREAEIVQRIELKGEGGLDLRAAEAYVQDGHRLEHHDLASDLPLEWDALQVPLLAGHISHIIGVVAVVLQRRHERAGLCHAGLGTPSVSPAKYHVTMGSKR